MKWLGFHFLFLTYCCTAQLIDYKRDDMFTNTVKAESHWWDLKYYHLDVTIDPEKKYISGKSSIRYEVLKSEKVLQVHLQEPLRIHKITDGKKQLDFKQVGTGSYFVELRKKQKIGVTNEITVYFSGSPKKVRNPEWNGQVLWKSRTKGRLYTASTAQYIAEGSWWPQKAHIYDRADSMLITINCPKHLMSVSNGRLRKVEEKGDWKTTEWFVVNPINNYCIYVNIGDYVHLGDTWKGEKGELDLSYWFLRDSVERAKERMKQIPKTLEALEYWLGPYPFYEDGFKVVDAPHANIMDDYLKPYRDAEQKDDQGKNDLELKRDLQLLPQFTQNIAYQWFANNIICRDNADLWIQEGFTTYSISLVMEYLYGKQAALEYLITLRKRMSSSVSLDTPYRYHDGFFPSDVGHKGANVLHTIRNWVDDDKKWRMILKDMGKTFRYHVVTAKEIEDYLAKKTGLPLSAFFFNYKIMKLPILPSFDYNINGKELKFRYSKVNINFEMPVRILVNDNPKWIYPKKNSQWKTETLEGDGIKFDNNFLLKYQKIE